MRRALEAAARNMTTLHVDHSALEDAVAAYPSVQGCASRPTSRTRVSIEVTEREPIAEVDLAGDVVPGRRRRPPDARRQARRAGCPSCTRRGSRPAAG